MQQIAPPEVAGVRCGLSDCSDQVPLEEHVIGIDISGICEHYSYTNTALADTQSVIDQRRAEGHRCDLVGDEHRKYRIRSDSSRLVYLSYVQRYYHPPKNHPSSATQGWQREENGWLAVREKRGHIQLRVRECGIYTTMNAGTQSNVQNVERGRV